MHMGIKYMLWFVLGWGEDPKYTYISLSLLAYVNISLYIYKHINEYMTVQKKKCIRYSPPDASRPRPGGGLLGRRRQPWGLFGEDRGRAQPFQQQLLGVWGRRLDGTFFFIPVDDVI